MSQERNELLQYLKSLSINELIGEIKGLNKLFLPVREYYQSKLSDTGENELLKKYINIVKNEFFPDRGFGKMRLSVAKKAITDFSKLSNNNENIAEIMLFYVEMGVGFTQSYGDINEPFYDSMEGMYDKVAEFTIEHHLENIFIERFKKIVEDTADMGWGFNESLETIFYENFEQ